MKNSVSQNSFRHKEEKYRAIVENSSHAFFLLTVSDGTILETNHAATAMFGYTHNEFKLLKNWHFIDHTDPGFIQALQQLEKTGFAITEATGMKKTGERFPVEITSTVFTDINGESRSSTMISDISVRKRTEAAMRLSNERFDLVVKATNDLVWDWDLVTGEVYRSGSGLADVYGHSSNETIKNINTWADYLHPLDKDKIIEQIAFYINSTEETAFSFEYRFRKEDGTYAYISDKGYIIRNEEGKVIRMIGAAEDISERKKAEESLLDSEERYRYLFNNSPSNIIIWDMDDYSIIEVNETSIDQYGYTREEFLQKTVLDMRPVTEHQKMAELVKEAAGSNEFKRSIICETITKNGTHLFMDNTAYKILYKGKQVILAHGNNVTEKIQLENSLNTEREIRQQQITEAVITGQEKERTELGQELHDNINQILASTKLYIDCALKDEEPRKDLIEESKSLIEKAMTEIRNLSKSLLPPSLGEIGLLQALTELAENIEEVNDLAISIEWNDIDENKFSDKLKLTIFRIVQEQLNNIIKHAAANDVLISINKADDILQVIIKDDGQGFDTAVKKNGVGLRNIISRAEVNNGKVIINSSPGTGCEIIVNFSVQDLIDQPG